MAISDKARDYWDRISPRERKLVVLLAFALPLCLAIWLGLSIRDGLVAMDERNERTRDALARVAKMKAAGGVQVEDPGVKIPDNPIPLETYVSKAAEKGGLKFKGPIDSRPKQTKNGFVTTTVSCALDDITTEQLKTFLQEIEADKVVAVTHLDIKREWKDKKKIDVTFEISTYSNAEKPKKDGEGNADEKSDEKDKKGS